ncbi:hypothetical protein EYF80_053520 [Liparis tanakae]|uniref:Uncharacterized protein n=1 Tax=Liparis tanakae TaxID=230148 RepID=A0A4Z2F5H4_9TELE|nr:hypothetical protein EYF80_053520 [Liparis tanakae]
MCACCGKSLAKSAGRSKGHGAGGKAFRDPRDGDSEEEEECRYEQPVRVAGRKHSVPRKLHGVPPPRHAARPWHKRGPPCRDASEPAATQEEGRELCKPAPGGGEAGEAGGGELQCRTCTDGLCREDLTAVDRSRWGDGDVIPRRRPASLLQRQETRKAMFYRPRDEDNEDDEPPPPLHWERAPR